MSKPVILMALYTGGQHSKEEERLLGTIENELGIRKLVEEHGYELITTDDKDPEPTSTFDKYLTELKSSSPLHSSQLMLQDQELPMLQT